MASEQDQAKQQRSVKRTVDCLEAGDRAAEVPAIQAQIPVHARHIHVRIRLGYNRAAASDRGLAFRKHLPVAFDPRRPAAGRVARQFGRPTAWQGAGAGDLVDVDAINPWRKPTPILFALVRLHRTHRIVTEASLSLCDVCHDAGESSLPVGSCRVHDHERRIVCEQHHQPPVSSQDPARPPLGSR